MKNINSLIKKIFRPLTGECKYVGTCNLYSQSSVTCNENKGMYDLDNGTMARCYVNLAEKEKNPDWLPGSLLE